MSKVVSKTTNETYHTVEISWEEVHSLIKDHASKMCSRPKSELITMDIHVSDMVYDRVNGKHYSATLGFLEKRS